MRNAISGGIKRRRPGTSPNHQLRLIISGEANLPPLLEVRAAPGSKDEEARPQCRGPGNGLGRAGDASRVEESSRSGWLECLRHRLDRCRYARSDLEPAAARQWR